MYAITAYGVQCLTAGCRGSGAGQPGVRPGKGMVHDYAIAAYGVQCLAAGSRESGVHPGRGMLHQSCSIPLPGRTPGCPAPDP